MERESGRNDVIVLNPKSTDEQRNADDRRYQFVRDGHTDERSRAERLDSKTSDMITAAGSLMALFMGLGTFTLSGVQKTNSLLLPLEVNLVSGLGMFSITLFVLLWTYKLAQYRSDPNPNAIIEKYANVSEEELLRQMTSNLTQAYNENKPINDSKARTLKTAIILLGGSIFAIFLFGVILVIALARQ